MPLLQMPGTGRVRDVLEATVAGVAIEAVRHQRAQAGLAGAQIDVLETVVVDIAEIRAHREHGFGEAGRRGHVRETAVAVIAIQPRLRSRRGQAQVTRRHRGQRVDRETREGPHEQVEPAVVVDVEEPRRKTRTRLRDPCAFRDIGEAPLPAGRTVVA